MIKSTFKLLNIVVFLLFVVALSHRYSFLVTFGVSIGYLVVQTLIGLKSPFLKYILRKPEYDSSDKKSISYIQDNVEYEFPDGNTTVTFTLNSEALYPVVIGLKGESNIGEFVDTQRELQPGDSMTIDKDVKDKMLKEEVFTITYSDGTTETVHTEVDAEFDGLWFCKNANFQRKNTIEEFNIEKPTGDTA